MKKGIVEIISTLIVVIAMMITSQEIRNEVRKLRTNDHMAKALAELKSNTPKPEEAKKPNHGGTFYMRVHKEEGVPK